MSTGIAQIVRPFRDGAAPPDSAHVAQLEMEMSQQTQALAYRCTGTTKNWVWPMPGGPDESSWSSRNSPSAELTTADTWTEFLIGGGVGIRFELPWRFTEGYQYVMAFITIVTNQELELTLRLSSETLLDAVATVNGEAGIRQTPRGSPDMHSWRDLVSGDSVYRSARYYCKLEPTVPANRRILLVPSIKCVDSYNPQFELGSVADVHIENMSFMDWPDDGKGFW